MIRIIHRAAALRPPTSISSTFTHLHCLSPEKTSLLRGISKFEVHFTRYIQILQPQFSWFESKTTCQMTITLFPGASSSSLVSPDATNINADDPSSSPDLATLNLSRLLTRLEHNLLSPAADLKLLRRSEYQRMRVGGVCLFHSISSLFMSYFLG